MDKDIIVSQNEITGQWEAYCTWHKHIIGNYDTERDAIFRAGFHVGYSH